jgi:hypothetical protein
VVGGGEAGAEEGERGEEPGHCPEATKAPARFQR